MATENNPSVPQQQGGDALTGSARTGLEWEATTAPESLTGRADQPKAAHLGPGSLVGGTWIIEKVLGKGGMGTVWLARHQRLANKRAAIKVLHGAGLSHEAYVRFSREAEIATRIGHPNIVDVLDMAALESGEPYIVLEYLQGETLRERLRRKKTLDYATTALLTRQLGSALLAAHRHQVVHRDLKPENVFLVPTDSGGLIRDHVKVLDFGISKLRGSETLQTQEAVVLGTPQYMAPEQATGLNHAVDGRTDQFALAVMVYEMLTGTPPWVADTPLGLLYQVVHAPTPELGQKLPQVPLAAVQAIEKALCKSADGRFGDIGQFVEALTGQPLQSLGDADSRTVPEELADAAVNSDTLDAPLVGDQTADGQLRTPLQATAPVAMDGPTAQVVTATPAGPSPTPADAPVPQKRSAAWTAAAATLAVIATAAALWAGQDRGEADPRRAPTEAKAEPASAVPPAQGDGQPAVAAAPAAVAPAVPSAAPASPAAPPPAAATTAQAPASAPEGAGARAAAAVADPQKAQAPRGVDKPLAPVDPEVLAAEAALKAGKLAEAARLAQHSLLAGKSPRALAVLTIVHCERGDLGGAQTWYGQISGSAKAAAKKACQKSGVEL